jgi:colanic acid/amylovoran biosynthesis glycosyltransferase
MARRNSTLVLFTTSYPYGDREHTFLKEELKVLAPVFNVILVPQYPENRTPYETPDGVDNCLDLSVKLKNIELSDKVKVLNYRMFLGALLKCILNKKKIKRAFSIALEGIVVSNWLEDYISKNNITKSLILYSFWNDSTTLGMTLVKRKHNSIKSITRCHNYDLYGNEDNSYYVPFQKEVFEKLDMVFPDSENGIKYIYKNFRKTKTSNGIMGVKYPGFQTQQSNDGVYRIASCAYMIPRKRIELFLQGLCLASRSSTTLNIEWYHIGSGPLWDELTELSKKILPSNCVAIFKGNLSYNEMMKFYKDNPVDLFVNTSEKEGTPVSVMEAISCGIPVLATAFGGNKEVIDSGGGILLSEYPAPEEIAKKIIGLMSAEDTTELVKSALKAWKKDYNSDKNYKEFTNNLLSLIE